MRLDEATLIRMAEAIYDEVSRYQHRRAHPSPLMNVPESFNERPAYATLIPSERIAYRNAALRAVNVLMEQEGTP